MTYNIKLDIRLAGVEFESILQTLDKQTISIFSNNSHSCLIIHSVPLCTIVFNDFATTPSTIYTSTEGRRLNNCAWCPLGTSTLFDPVSHTTSRIILF